MKLSIFERNLIRKVEDFFNNVFDKLPIELHVLGFEYLGPGTNYDLKQEKRC